MPMMPFLLNDLSREVESDAGLLVHEHLAGHRLADEHVLVLRMPLDQASKNTEKQLKATCTSFHSSIFH